MARICNMCGRGALAGHTRSHSNVATKVKREINLQSLRIGGWRVRACTSCVRTEMKRLKTATSV